MIKLLKLHHVSFAIRHLETSKHFFAEVLGLPEIERPAFDFPGAWYALGDRQLHLIEQSAAGREVGGRISRADHLALEVEDVQAVKRRLSEKGVEFGEGTNQKLGMDQIFCRDPDGHVIEFVSYFTK